MVEWNGDYIYESPDGKHVFRRPIGEYNIDSKEEINLKTGKPTGRMFSEYPFNKNEFLLTIVQRTIVC